MRDYLKFDKPRGWKFASLNTVTELNPRLEAVTREDNPSVSFVPMPAVEPGTGIVDVSRTRRLEEVKKGYTHFKKDDVIFAKITPCMENGKMAVMPSLVNDLGFGSTEFHVLRPHRGISPRYIYYFISSEIFRSKAQHNMTGAVGQRRVPASFMDEQIIPIPPAHEQSRIVSKIKELFSELDKGVESLKTVRAKLNVYRQTVLKHAFEGKLTEQWREENKDKLETPDQLLARIKQERSARYKKQLREWETAVKEWEQNEKKGKKPEIPRESNPVESIEEVICRKLPTIADRWVWIRLKQVGRIETGKTPSTRYSGNYGGKLPFFKPTDLDQGVHVQTAREFLSEIGAESARVLPADSILVTCIGATIGKTGFARLSCATNQQINSVSPDAGFDSKFVYLQALAPFFNSKVKSEASATTLPILNKSKFEELPFILCTLTEQQEIVRLLEKQFVAIEQQEREVDSALEQAEMLRQSILKKAFAGQLVPQDPHDEPASELFKRITEEKARRDTAVKVATKKAPP